MLPGQHRITRSEDFARVIRRGSRAGRPTLVVHLMVENTDAAPARAGFVVSKSVGTAVVRHRVTRRLRHGARSLLPELPHGALFVVRALPPAAAAGGELFDDLSKALARALRRGRLG